MTLEIALQQAGALFDQHTAQAMASAEFMLREKSASEPEVMQTLAWLRAQHEAARCDLLMRIFNSWSVPPVRH
jgi:hypothetical protein